MKCRKCGETAVINMRQHKLALFEVRGIAESQGLETRGLDFQKRKVEQAILPNELSIEHRTLFGCAICSDADGARAFNHMRVGHDVSVLRYDHAGACTALSGKNARSGVLCVGLQAVSCCRNLYHGRRDPAGKILQRAAELPERGSVAAPALSPRRRGEKQQEHSHGN